MFGSIAYSDAAGKKRSVEIGDLDRYPTKAQALRAAEHLRMNINPDTAVQRGVTFGVLLDRYDAEEMPTRYSTSTAYRRHPHHTRPKWAGYELAAREGFRCGAVAEDTKLGTEVQESHQDDHAERVRVCDALGNGFLWAEPDEPCAGPGVFQTSESSSSAFGRGMPETACASPGRAVPDHVDGCDVSGPSLLGMGRAAMAGCGFRCRDDLHQPRHCGQSRG